MLKKKRVPCFYFRQEDKQKIVKVLKSKFPEDAAEIIKAADKTVARTYEFINIKKVFKKEIGFSLLKQVPNVLYPV